METVLFDIGIILAIASFFALIARAFHQPLIVAYIFTGVFAGVVGLFAKTESRQLLDFFATFGITSLLFLVGLELRFTDIKSYGLASLLTGLGQIIFTGLVSFALILLLGFSAIQSFYIALALTFSSTVIIIKLLTEKRDLDSLYGRITVGFLLVQDAVAILALILVSALGRGNASFGEFVLVVFKGVLLVLLTLILSKTLVPRLFRYASHSVEVLFILAIAWMLLVSSLSLFLNLSVEIGAFLAGVSLANLREEQQISSRIKPLRDLFVVFFFILLGVSFTFQNVVSDLLPIVALSLLILVGNPLIVMIIMGFLGFRKRTSFMASVTVAQISEFSLILVALGVSVGHLDQRIVSIVTAVGLITILCSSYMILASRKLYRLLSPYLSIFQRKNTFEDFDVSEKQLEDHVVLIGAGRLGFEILKQLKKQNFPTLVVDFNPEIVSYLKSENIDFLFGDITDEEIGERASLGRAKIVLSTVFDPDDTLELLRSLKLLSRKPIIVVTAAEREWAVRFYQNGADYVIVPRILSGHQVAHLLTEKKLEEMREGSLKEEHLQEIKEAMEKLSL